MSYTGKTVNYGALESGVYAADGTFDNIPARPGIYILAVHTGESWRFLCVGQAG